MTAKKRDRLALTLPELKVRLERDSTSEPSLRSDGIFARAYASLSSLEWVTKHYWMLWRNGQEVSPQTGLPYGVIRNHYLSLKRYVRECRN